MISPTARSRLKPWRRSSRTCSRGRTPPATKRRACRGRPRECRRSRCRCRMPTSKSHFTVPSVERCSDRIARRLHLRDRLQLLAQRLRRSVIASKSATPRWWIHCIPAPRETASRLLGEPFGQPRQREVQQIDLVSRLVPRTSWVIGSRPAVRGRSTRSRSPPSPARPSRAPRWRRSIARNPRGSCPSRPSSDRWRPSGRDS